MIKLDMEEKILSKLKHSFNEKRLNRDKTVSRRRLID